MSYALRLERVGILMGSYVQILSCINTKIMDGPLSWTSPQHGKYLNDFPFDPFLSKMSQSSRGITLALSGLAGVCQFPVLMCAAFDAAVIPILLNVRHIH